MNKQLYQSHVARQNGMSSPTASSQFTHPILPAMELDLFSFFSCRMAWSLGHLKVKTPLSGHELGKV